ncbi:hypothetical protein CRENPOLYSF2_1380002 [Crenothrix polyspora]|uniref:Uncharacterized protein n=1 Tax=Crenothrix polyspora TaxID=360316 RepID=A0A1R4H0X1_9GAMM|nr:hypothetical protein CRENPOLYSF2_1380002 [Crenothrix polyspora]
MQMQDLVNCRTGSLEIKTDNDLLSV